MSKLIVLALVALLAVAFAQDDNDVCGKCQIMCANAKVNYNNDFTNVTKDQLVVYMEGQCKGQFSGVNQSICKSVVDKNGDKMLAAFKRGDTNQQICAEGGLC